MTTNIVLCAPVRTAIGAYGGTLKDITAPKLGSIAIARVLSYQAIDAIAAGTLVSLHDDVAPPPVPVHLVYQANRRASVNVRAFVEAAREHFSCLDLTARSHMGLLGEADRATA